eukprot:COSAG02_NODE_6810_length_3349_cov_1.738462_2_plen_170_part_00
MLAHAQHEDEDWGDPDDCTAGIYCDETAFKAGGGYAAVWGYDDDVNHVVSARIDSDDHMMWVVDFGSHASDVRGGVSFQSYNEDDLTLHVGWCSTMHGIDWFADCTWAQADVSSGDDAAEDSVWALPSNPYRQNVAALRLSCNNVFGQCKLSVNSVVVGNGDFWSGAGH